MYECKYHFVWVPKYRFKVLDGEVREGLRRILEQLCNWKEVVIIEGCNPKGSCPFVLECAAEDVTIRGNEGVKG